MFCLLAWYPATLLRICVCSAVSSSLRPHVQYPIERLCPCDSPGKNTEWVALSFSRGSSWPRDQIHISSVSSVSRQTLYAWATWEAPALLYLLVNAPLPLLSRFSRVNAELFNRSVGFSTLTLICLLWIKIVLFLFFYIPFVSFSLFFSLKSAFPSFENSNVRFLLKPYFLSCILLVCQTYLWVW